MQFCDRCRKGNENAPNLKTHECSQYKGICKKNNPGEATTSGGSRAANNDELKIMNNGY